MLITHNKPGRKENFVNLIKGIYFKKTIDIILSGEKLNFVSLRLGRFIVLEVPASEVKQENNKPKAYRPGKKLMFHSHIKWSCV